MGVVKRCQSRRQAAPAAPSQDYWLQSPTELAVAALGYSPTGPACEPAASLKLINSKSGSRSRASDPRASGRKNPRSHQT